MYRIFDDTTTLTPTATTYATLFLALQTLTAVGIALTNTGGEVSRTGAADRYVEFFAPSESGTSSADIIELIGELRLLYDESVTVLISSGIAVPTDLQIWNEMKMRLGPVQEFGPSVFHTVGL